MTKTQPETPATSSNPVSTLSVTDISDCMPILDDLRKAVDAKEVSNDTDK